jgi:hypothetical protein
MTESLADAADAAVPLARTLGAVAALNNKEAALSAAQLIRMRGALARAVHHSAMGCVLACQCKTL